MAAKKRKTRRPSPKPSSASRVPQPLPSDALVYAEYDVTDEPLDNRDIKRLPSQVQERIDDLYELAQHEPTQAIPELERLVMTYPHIPTFLNHLSIAYLAAGDQEQATAMVREAYRRHPQYLFAKVNYANLCLQQGEIEKVPGIFDHAFDLKQLYPHRKRFHVSEFTGFAWVMCRYFCANWLRVLQIDLTSCSSERKLLQARAVQHEHQSQKPYDHLHLVPCCTTESTAFF